MADSVKHSYIRQALADSCLIWQLSDLTAVRSDSCQTWQLSKWKILGKISSPLHTAKIHEAQLELCFSKKKHHTSIQAYKSKNKKGNSIQCYSFFETLLYLKSTLENTPRLNNKATDDSLVDFDQQRKNDNSVVLFSYGEKMSII